MLRDLGARLEAADWPDGPLPSGRRHWRIPCAVDGAAGPQLAEAADMAGRSPEDALRDITGADLRIITIGFAAGQP